MQLHQQELVETSGGGDLDSIKSDGELRGHRLALTCVCLDSKDRYAFTGSKDGSIIKWCLQNSNDNKFTTILGKIKSIPTKEYESNVKLQKKNHTRHINCLAISTDGKFLASGGWDKHIRIWNPDDLSWIHTFTLHKQEVTSLAFRQGYNQLYSGSADRTVMLWSLEDDDNRCYVESLYGHESPITSMDALKRERILTSGGRDQSIRIWKIVEQAQTVFECKHESVDIVRLIDDQFFVSGGEDGTISVWTTMKRSPLVSVQNAHKPSKKDEKGNEGLSYWITSLAVHSFKKAISKQEKAIKKRKMRNKDAEDDDDDDQNDDDVLIAKYGSDDEDNESDDQIESDNEAPAEEQPTNKSVVALVASGSCDSIIRIWQLVKSGGKYEMKLFQSIECKGFVNDLKFSSQGEKLVAACGQEHRFGRWWKLKGSNNCLRVFDVNK